MAEVARIIPAPNEGFRAFGPDDVAPACLRRIVAAIATDVEPSAHHSRAPPRKKQSTWAATPSGRRARTVFSSGASQNVPRTTPKMPRTGSRVPRTGSTRRKWAGIRNGRAEVKRVQRNWRGTHHRRRSYPSHHRNGGRVDKRCCDGAAPSTPERRAYRSNGWRTGQTALVHS